MRVYFNIYGENLGILKGGDLELDHIHFLSHGKEYNLDLAGTCQISYEESIEGYIACDEIDLDGNRYEVNELEKALIDAIDIELHAHLDFDEDERFVTNEGIRELESVHLTSYDMQIIIGLADRAVHKDFKE